MANSASNKSPSGSVVPPDVFGVALAATENGTKGGGVGGTMSLAGDPWRYRGALGKTSVNLEFYGLGTELGSDQKNIGYNLDEDRRRHTVTDGGIVVVTTDDEPLIGSISEDALTFEAEADRRGAGG